MDDIKVTHTTRDAKDDPYHRLMEQLVREEELDGIAIITLKSEKEKMTFNSRSHGGVIPGSGGIMEMLTRIGANAMIAAMKTLVLAFRHDREGDGHGN